MSRISVLEGRVGGLLRRRDQGCLERFEGFFEQCDQLLEELYPAVVALANTVMISGDADFQRIAGLNLRLIH